MSLYSVVLFLHIAGALGLFVALGLEWVTLRGLRTATTAEQAQAWLGASAPVRWLTIGAMTALLLPGMYMAATVWQGTPWIGLGLGGLVTMAILSIVPTGRRMAQISREVAREEGPLSLALRPRLHDPLIWTSLVTRTAIALGVVWLMTVKLDLVGSLVAIVTAIVLGLLASLPAWSRARAERVAA